MKPITVLLGLTVWLMSGCVLGPLPRYRVRETAPPLSYEEIVRMTKAGLSDAIIADKLNADGLEARPTAEQIAALKKDGVSDGVLRAMLTAPLRERTQERLVYTEGYYPYYPYSYGSWWCGPYWYGWPYWGWQFNYYPFHGWGYRGGYGPVRRYRP